MLVLGGTGKTGRRVVERLEARGMPVRVGSRSGNPPFDWENREHLGSRGARALESAYISYYPDLAVPGRGRHAWRSFVDLAAAQRYPATRALVRPR